MKAFLVGKTVNIEYLVSDFCGECLRVSSMKELDWERYGASDVVFCLFGEFEKPADLEKRIVSIQLFSADQAEEIAQMGEEEGEESHTVFYLPFECDKKDIEDLWIMIMAVLKQEDLEKDVEGVEEYLKEQEEEAKQAAAEEESVDLDHEVDLEDEDIDLEDTDIDLDEENMELEIGDDDLDEQEELAMSGEDDDLDVEMEFDMGDDDDDGELTSEVVDLDFSADDDIEIDTEASEAFLSPSDEEDATGEIDGEGFDLSFGEDEEIDLGGGDDVDLGGSDDMEVDMDRTGEFEFDAGDDDGDGGADVLAFNGGDDDEEIDLGGDEEDIDLGGEDEDIDLGGVSFEDEDGDISEVSEVYLDFSSDDDEDTEHTRIADDLEALKAEAKANPGQSLSGVEDGEVIEAEDGFVLETYDDDELEADDEAETDAGLDFSADDMGMDLGEEDETRGIDLGGDGLDFGGDDDEMDLGDDDEEDDDLGIDLSGGDDGGETVTVFQEQDNDATSEFALSGDDAEEEVGGMEMDFGGGDDVADFSSPVASEPPPVQANEVLNFGGISDEKDLINMQSTIREIREERQEFLNRIQQLETLNKELKQENLTLKAELDEKRIELSVVQKRQVSDREDVREKLRLSEEKKLLYEEKLKRVEREYEKLEHKVHIDVEKVRKRERELENQLELVKMDAQAQIKTRDSKIMDLKRKMDSLEFNVKTSATREQKNLEEKLRLEARMEKVMEQLRSSVRMLEDEVSVEDIKKIESH